MTSEVSRGPFRAAVSCRPAIRGGAAKMAFDCEKQNTGDDVDAEFDADKRGHCGKIDVVR